MFSICLQVSRETSILKKLSTGGGAGHPHVVRLYDMIETDMKYYMVSKQHSCYKKSFMAFQHEGTNSFFLR